MVRVLALALAFTACDGDDTTGDDGASDTGGATGPLSFTFRSEIPAVTYEAEIVDAALRAHQVSNMLLSSAKVVVADEKVQDRLNVDGAGGLFRAAGVQCWSRPQFPMFDFTIDYEPCGNYYMGGGVFIEDHPSGPLLFDFFNFVERERELGGTLAFDTRGAFDAPLYWEVYTTDAENPGLDNPVQIGVTLDDNVTYGLSYSGGASIDLVNQEWSMWGVMTIGVGKDSVEVVHGAASAEEVAPDEPTGDDVVQSDLNWLACRCPRSGVESQDMPLQFTSVTIDIDDLEETPDAVDDPAFTVEVDHEVPGNGVLTRTGCGTYDVAYTATEATIPVDSGLVIGGISFLCATLEINDPARCAALTNAASQVSLYEVQITADQARETALDAVNSDFDDQGWCSAY